MYHVLGVALNPIAVAFVLENIDRISLFLTWTVHLVEITLLYCLTVNISRITGYLEWIGEVSLQSVFSASFGLFFVAEKGNKAKKFPWSMALHLQIQQIFHIN